MHEHRKINKILKRLLQGSLKENKKMYEQTVKEIEKGCDNQVNVALGISNVNECETFKCLANQFTFIRYFPQATLNHNNNYIITILVYCLINKNALKCLALLWCPV